MSGQRSTSSATSSNWATRWARIYSHVVSPPTIFAVLGFPVAWAELPLAEGALWGSLYAVFVSGIPMLVVAYLMRTGRLHDLHMGAARERHIPYLVTFLCAAALLVITYAAGGPRLFRPLLICNVIGLAALGLINIVWLISNHAGSIMLATTYIGFVYGLLAAAFLLPLVVLVLAARLVLRRHTIPQLIGGLLVGAVPVLAFAGLGLIR